MNNFGFKLAKAIEEKGISQRKLSMMTGITPSSISDWINDKYEPKPDKIKLVADALNVTPAYLMGWADKTEFIDTLIDVATLSHKIERLNLYTDLKKYAIQNGIGIDVLLKNYFEFVRNGITHNKVDYNFDYLFTLRNVFSHFRSFFTGPTVLTDDDINSLSDYMLGHLFDLEDDNFTKSELPEFDFSYEEIIMESNTDRYGKMSPENISIEYERDIYLLKLKNQLSNDAFNLAINKIKEVQKELNSDLFALFDNEFNDFLSGNLHIIDNIDYRVMTSVVPVYGRIPAGTPFEAIQECLDNISIPDWLAKKKDLFGLLVVGESMNKVLPNGVVAVIQKCEDLENGEIGAILVNGYDATVKRFYRLNNSIVLEPDSYSKDFEPMIIREDAEEVKVIGKVLWYSPVGEIK